MALESMTKTVADFNRQAGENYWKTVEQMTETADRMSDSFLAAVPGLPAESVQWLNNWRTQSKQELEKIKQKMNKNASDVPTFEWQNEYSKKAMEAYQEQVTRLFDQTIAFREKGKEVVTQFTEQVPEPGKQWLKQWEEMTDKGLETLKSMMLGEFDPTGGFRSESATDSKSSAKTTGKTTNKNKTN